MTIENMLGFRAGTMLPEQMTAPHDSLVTLPITTPTRVRNYSGGSTGSYSSSSSYGSDKSQTTDILSYHLAQTQVCMTMAGQQYQKLDRSLSMPASDRQSTQKNVNPTRYKTELCRPFEESGYCKYGEKCQFAHGGNEQRNLSRHPKYKTELCRTYHTVGFCPYGPRCHFVHNEDDMKLNEITHLKQQHMLKQVAQQQHAQQQQQQAQSRAFQQQMEQQQQLRRAQTLQRSASLGAPMVAPQYTSRPRTLDFTGLSLMALGSTADSPPASISSSSPSLSPTSMLSDDVFSGIPTPPPGFSALPPRAPQSVSQVFNFGADVSSSVSVPTSAPSLPTADYPVSPILNVSSAAAPLNISVDPVNSLAASLQATRLEEPSESTIAALRDCLGELFGAPPTPPLSVDSSDEAFCESPMDIGKGFRLPIFNQIA